MKTYLSVSSLNAHPILRYKVSFLLSMIFSCWCFSIYYNFFNSSKYPMLASTALFSHTDNGSLTGFKPSTNYNMDLTNF